MTHSPLTNAINLSGQNSSRNGAKVDRFIVHHTASVNNHDGVVNMMVRATREVSANYVVSEKITCVVDEDRRAWTSASAHWDGRAITAEVVNNSSNGWTVSDKTFDNLARLIADVSKRYGFPINNDTILTHQELYKRYGASYATACPGDLQRRKAELINLANKYRTGGTGGSYASPSNPVSASNGWDYSGGIAVPRGELMARIQRALRARGRYSGPADGISGPYTIKGIQMTIARGGGYSGPIDGELGPNGARAVQRYAQEWGDYTGPIDGDPRDNSWANFALGLERP